MLTHRVRFFCSHTLKKTFCIEDIPTKPCLPQLHSVPMPTNDAIEKPKEGPSADPMQFQSQPLHVITTHRFNPRELPGRKPTNRKPQTYRLPCRRRRAEHVPLLLTPHSTAAPLQTRPSRVPPALDRDIPHGPHNRTATRDDDLVLQRWFPDAWWFAGLGGAKGVDGLGKRRLGR